MCNFPVTSDLRDQMAIMKANHEPQPYTLRAPKSYVQLLLAELRDGGIDLGDARDDSIVKVEFTDGSVMMVETDV